MTELSTPGHFGAKPGQRVIAEQIALRDKRRSSPY